jgi:pyrroline-5-carboxylate reductase
MKLTFVGAGNMAEAIIAGVYKKHEVEVAARDQKALDKIKDKYNVKTTLLRDSLDIELINLNVKIKHYKSRKVWKL